MSKSLTRSIAQALLIARWRQTLVAAIGVAFSITMFIALLSFMEGLNDMLDGLFLNRTPHVRLYNETKPRQVQPVNMQHDFLTAHNFIRSIRSTNARTSIRGSMGLLTRLKKDKRVTGIAPKITTPVLFNNAATDLNGVLNGIEVANEAVLFHFTDYIVEGNANDIEKIPNSIILGKRLAEILAVEPGERVQLATPGGERFQLKVIGLYQSGIDEIDKVQSFASLATVQKLMQQPPSFLTDIQVKLQDVEAAPAVAREYRRIYPVSAVDIQTANAEFETGSFIRTLISYAVGIVLLIVAGFGIYNILNMMIYEKMDTLAILKATGFSARDVKRVFLLISVTIGLAGCITGLICGFLVSLAVDQVPFSSSSLPTMTTYPVSYNPVFYVIGMLFSIATTILAGWLPARKASKVDPVIILRGK